MIHMRGRECCGERVRKDIAFRIARREMEEMTLRGTVKTKGYMVVAGRERHQSETRLGESYRPQREHLFPEDDYRRDSSIWRTYHMKWLRGNNRRF